MNKIKLGLLPLYIQLYDNSSPKMRPRIEAFYNSAAEFLHRRGDELSIEVITSPVCRLKEEFDNAVSSFKQNNAEGIITLHLAYSPSLQSIDSICGSGLPVLVLDITEANSFDPDQAAAEISYNHGIHGVQDLCNMMIRRGKQFEIAAGHIGSKHVAEKVVSWVRAIRGAASFRNSKTGIIGKPFAGMGDFQIPFDTLKNRFGINTIEYDAAEGRHCLETLGESEIQDEISMLKSKFDCSTVNDGELTKTAKTNLVIRKWMEKEKLNAFTANFLDVKKGMGLCSVPFTAASLAMAGGAGYGGEAFPNWYPGSPGWFGH